MALAPLSAGAMALSAPCALCWPPPRTLAHLVSELLVCKRMYAP